MNRGFIRTVVVVLAMAVPAAGWAQQVTTEGQQLDTTHSVLQKAGIGTIALTGATGLALMINRPTLFGDGRCSEGNGLFGGFGCGPGLTLLHAAFAVTSAGLFIAQELIAAEMNPSPYDEGSPRRQNVTEALRWTNVGLFAVQPVLGLIAAHPGLVGVPREYHAQFGRVMRTIHFGVGLGLATTYTVNAAFMW
jgi:hypothetical protein